MQKEEQNLSFIKIPEVCSGICCNKMRIDVLARSMYYNKILSNERRDFYF